MPGIAGLLGYQSNLVSPECQSAEAAQNDHGDSTSPIFFLQIELLEGLHKAISCWKYRSAGNQANMEHWQWGEGREERLQNHKRWSQCPDHTCDLAWK